jgi:hypothetical protein
MPTIAKWARREAAHGVITLFESDGAEPSGSRRGVLSVERRSSAR